VHAFLSVHLVIFFMPVNEIPRKAVINKSADSFLSLSLSLFKFSFVIHTVHVCISGDENHLRFCKDLFLFTLKRKEKVFIVLNSCFFLH